MKIKNIFSIILFTLLSCNITFAMEEEDHCHDCNDKQENSLFWSTVNNPYAVMIISIVAQKYILTPLFECIENTSKNLYNNYWLTSEQKKQIEEEQQKNNVQLLEDFQKAEMKSYV